MVQLNAAETGNWTVQVVGSSIPKGAQDFAVVILSNVS
jgi:hypothetical protein